MNKNATCWHKGGFAADLRRSGDLFFSYRLIEDHVGHLGAYARQKSKKITNIRSIIPLDGPWDTV